MVGTEAPQTVRAAEVLASLSLVTDLARGHPPEEAMRACLLATAVGRHLRLPDGQLADAYYASLLRFVGCTATSTLLATGFGGDDVEVRRLGDLTDFSVPREALGFLWTVYRRAGAARPETYGHTPALSRRSEAIRGWRSVPVRSRAPSRSGGQAPVRWRA